MASNRSERLRSAKICLVLLLVTASLFVAMSCSTVTPQQGWSERWGPLVPHETFPSDCGLCHVAERWDVLRPDFSFDHATQTGFALEGAHATAACLRCHNDRGPVSAYVARGCAGCHPDPHQGTLGLDCKRCHEQSTWRPGGLVSEHARTRFPLVGAHAIAPCERCHERAPVGEFRGAPVECDQCHQRDLARATNPDHRASGFVRDCERCHVPTSWSPASFGHDSFPLRGGHSGLPCTRCHTSGTFGRIPSNCYSCHQADYERAPNHVSLGFPRDCRQCHGTSSFSGARFDHPAFPLRGPHDVSCTRCHTTGNTSQFTCLECHRQGETDREHREVRGYSYDSKACYRCHRNGRE